MGFLHEAVVFLIAAVIAVSLFKRTGLGSVLGYLVAGVAIGPSGLRFVSEVESVMRFAELGVVLLLFIIGLELQPSRLWQMRGHVFGLGGAQVGVTTALLSAVALALGQPLVTALVMGFALSLSSTALAVQVLAEKHQLTTQPGRMAFGVLLFQDLAAIPFLAVLPLLGTHGAPAPEGGVGLGLLKVVATFGGMVVASRVVLRPVLKAVAALHSQEVFTAFALLVVAGTAVLMESIGLSATLGAFSAGVLLADSEYRHELEADIEPFKGLLLGLFFMAVGMSANLALLTKQPALVAALVAGLLALKAAVLFAIGWWRLRSTLGALRLAISTSQGGEFAFVVFGLATSTAALTPELSQLLVLVVSLSLAVTPVAFATFERFAAPRLAPKKAHKAFDDLAHDGEPPVVIAGFGRVGQVVGRVLMARRIPFVALDASSEHVDFVRRFGNKVFYGDASRLELLEAAGAAKARLFVLAIDDVEKSVEVAKTVQKHFPHLTLVARARNRQHAYELLALGVTHLMRETFVSSLEMSGDVLGLLGMPGSEVAKTLAAFRSHDEALLMDSFQHRDDVSKLQERAKQARAELEKLFEADAKEPPK
ncbi:MAG: cation:proton antiporter [Myxococcaceae bacterium]|jgi:glutathione-regulated potassium-efflux system ancillary protein KefC|nr:cation:proton antiporter [Myxococcaceae bacterium]